MNRVIVSLALAASCCFPGPDAASDEAEPTPAQIRAWLAELEAAQFVKRERATAQLIAAGGAAIQPIVANLGQGDREFRTRAVHILHRLALSGERKAEASAYQALTKLVASGPANVVTIADKSLAQIHDLREQRAIKWLRARGARIEDSYQQFGFAPSSSGLTVEISKTWKGDEQDLEQLRWLRSVRNVVLTGEQVNENWFKHVLRMEMLTSLSVKRGKISDKTVARIVASSPNLKTLKLKYVPISDACVDDLAKMKTAVQLQLYGTQITEVAARRLKGELKDVDVDFRAGGFLGVGCQPHPLGCLIALVHPGSAADRAQFTPGDIIVSYGGKSVVDFDELTRLISSDEVGKKVAVVVARRVRTLGTRWAAKEDEPLGADLEDHPAGAKVIRVGGQSIARRMGLREGDVLFQVDAERIISADSFAKAYAAVQPGRLASLQFARGGQILERDVALGEWD